MNTFMTAQNAILKLKEHTGIQNNDELAKKIGVPGTAINVFLNGAYSNVRKYNTILFGAEKNLGLTEDFFYEGDTTWTPAKPAVKVEIIGSKAVKPETESPFGDGSEEPKAAKPVEFKAEPAPAPAPAPAPVPVPAKVSAAVPGEDHSALVAEMVRLTKAGMSRKEMCQHLGIGKTTMYKYCKQAGVSLDEITPPKNGTGKPETKPAAPAEEPKAEVKEEVKPAEEAAVAETPVAEEVPEVKAEAPAAEPVKEEEVPETKAEPEVKEEVPAPEKPVAEIKSEPVETVKGTVPEAPAKAESEVEAAVKALQRRSDKLLTLLNKATTLPDHLLDALLTVAESMKA